MLALLAILLTLTACGGEGGKQGGAGASAKFVETDGWWSIKVPATWSATRVELDGARTPLTRWQSSPSPSTSPTRDPNSSAVYYEFQPPDASAGCRDCPAPPEGRIVVVARPLTDSARLAEEIARDVGRDPEIRDLKVADGECGVPNCRLISYATPTLESRVLIRSDERQRRTYEIRATASPARWPQVGPVLDEALKSFEPGARSA